MYNDMFVIPDHGKQMLCIDHHEQFTVSFRDEAEGSAFVERLCSKKIPLPEDMELGEGEIEGTVPILLHAPQDFNNLCVLVRTLEVFGIDSCYVYDPNRMIRDRYGKSYRRRANKLSAGAFSKMRFEKLEDPIAFLRSYQGRKIATVVSNAAKALDEVDPRPSDLIVFGGETSGLDPKVIEVCDLSITIPQRGATQSLNLCVAAGIILYEWLRQTGSGAPSG